MFRAACFIVAAARLLAVATLVSGALVASEARAASPVILVPGFMGWRDMRAMGPYFTGLQAALEAEGADVTAIALSPIADSEARAAELVRAIDAVRRRTGAKKVAIIAHSQGGVDVRVALARGAAEKVAVVATLSSPHAGTPLADVALEWPRPLLRATLDWIAGTWQSEQHVTRTEPQAERAVHGLSVAGMRARNSSLPTTSTVPFFSLASLSGKDVDGSCSGGAWDAPTKQDELHPLFVPARTLLRSLAGDVSDDGVVPTASMRFGTFLGCVPGDHVDWMGWRFDRTDEDYAEFDERAFLAELWRGMRDVEAAGDARAMDAHVPALAALASAVPHKDLDGPRMAAAR